MTLEASLEITAGTAAPEGDGVGQQSPVPVARRLSTRPARLVLGIPAGAAAAVLLGSRPALAAVVVVVWTLAVVPGAAGRLGRTAPGAALLRPATMPVSVVAVAAVAGVVSDRGMTHAVLITAAMTAGAAVADLAVRSAQRPPRVLLVGDRTTVGPLVVEWGQAPDLSLVGVALTDGDDSDLGFESFGLPVVRGTAAVRGEAQRLRADTVVLLPGATVGADDVRRLGWSLEGTGATLAVRTEVGAACRHRLAPSDLGGATLVEIASSRPPACSRVAKAAFDRVVGAVLLVLAAPLLVALVVAVRLETPGPGLFTQTRIGKDGRPFRVYKLRTMCAEAERLKADLGCVDEGNGVLFKIRRDPRITRLGQVLRTTSLDELPQLLNVVRGEMSLVGPRPALPHEVATYDDTARRRLAVRPGMTGLWQVSGRSDLDWSTTVALDLLYTDNITLGRDLGICLRTVRAVASRKGAY